MFGERALPLLVAQPTQVEIVVGELGANGSAVVGEAGEDPDEGDAAFLSQTRDLLPFAAGSDAVAQEDDVVGRDDTPPSLR